LPVYKALPDLALLFAQCNKLRMHAGVLASTYHLHVYAKLFGAVQQTLILGCAPNASCDGGRLCINPISSSYKTQWNNLQASWLVGLCTSDACFDC